MLKLSHDLADYADYINSEIIAGRPLAEYVAEVQRIYCLDNRPWIIGYSGGKDSTAVTTLIYLALLGLPPESRSKNVFLITSDTLVETPVVVDLIKNSMTLIEQSAKRDGLPITQHTVMPKTEETFWVNLLGKGYPAPSRSFRWCTERMKIDPVSEFIKEKISQYDEVIILLGARSDESSSRAQVIAKHRIDGSRLARHTSLANAFVYTPIDTWSTEEVWALLRGAFKYSQNDIEEWETPWGGNNRPLWTLYMHSSSQGECPLVIDESTPSCGNSRFGCWTCTVVTKDKAMENLIQNGEDWMLPLLSFRDLLAKTTEPDQKETYRNYKRRNGRVTYQYAKDGDDLLAERKHIPGPYWMKYRKSWLRELLNLDKRLNDEGHTISLITEPELHAIRQQWLRDPNEPDWADELPSIFFEVYGKNLDWIIDDQSQFDQHDSALLKEVSDLNFSFSEMLMKLIELEVSMEGLSRRQGIFEKIESVLSKDWGSLEKIQESQSQLQKRHEKDIHKTEIEQIERELHAVSAQLQATKLQLQTRKTEH
ncbi:DNA phosphorothioation system sulfurtransferase DndC [Pseudomonas viridiflava]|uniref:DNA phosphorothioation system sulfurtransferase DndC n=1 Tax=Pseudomonas viridiflava TaxID=33069 RepID=UPI002EA411D0|nr:DNA phosphorothioation system sulfurtransferase DndC [Pseudomonas viridiflava]